MVVFDEIQEYLFMKNIEQTIHQRLKFLDNFDIQYIKSITFLNSGIDFMSHFNHTIFDDILTCWMEGYSILNISRILDKSPDILKVIVSEKYNTIFREKSFLTPQMFRDVLFETHEKPCLINLLMDLFAMNLIKLSQNIEAHVEI